MSIDPTQPGGGSEHADAASPDAAAPGVRRAGVADAGVADAGVPGPGVDAPLFTTQLIEPLDQALRDFAARGPVLLALDFDGALAPIVVDPSTSRMLPASAQAIAQLTTLPGVDVALVSGRTAEDLVRLTDLPEGTRVVGSHGAQVGTVARSANGERVLEGQPVDLSPAQAELHATLRAQAEELVAGVPGTGVEIKPAAVVVHTRGATHPDADRITEAALTGPGALDGVRTLRGKEVVEMAVLDVTKGDAVQLLRTATDAHAVLYAGDDRTDEDAFAVLQDGDVSIKVGEGDTRAQYRVPDPEGMAAVLMRLTELFGER